MTARGRRSRKKPFDWLGFLEKYKWSVGVGLIGLTLMGVGILSFFSSQEKVAVEILPAEEEEEEGTIWVDIEGAVEKPGIYELEGGSRVNDVLIKAGGLSGAADRDWVEKNVNLAQKLSDGVKIYIPRSGESKTGSVAGEGLTGKININTASVSELDTLWGIGPARAGEIVANRPYAAVEELETKAKIPSNVYERIKDEVSLY